ncbi:Zn-dependent hydrolase [Erythrobacter sp. KY5]|uniref:MBL fold metallo-hydrolase n=1 Tax=Erythrobacter sp. KY5 TaxID=2011159 RepID=UPI000DBF2B70|nr:MBL fold metallo-hydrolase [Erythrobacter sp. KY5]AWW74760.1 Zn-dependent hydrolase [Erythrobacter sp. KY5]
MTRTAITIAISTASLLAAAPLAAQDQGNQPEIRTEVLAPGIAVLFTGRAGNMGVSYGEDATILIDDQFAPMAPAIEAAIAALGATPVEYLVNTHWHGDHTGGNEHFGESGATIFAHDNVRIRLSEPQQRGERTIGPSPKEALPVVTYPQGMRFHLNGDTINLMYFGGGHTDGDSVVFWEEDNIVHMGDLYFKIPGFPFIDVASGGNVYNAMRTLDLIIMMIDDETKVIPGHGPMSNKAELEAYRAMVGEAVSRVEASREEGNSLDQTIDARLLDDFERGEGFIDADGFVTAIWNSAE